jgi:hypothetical protein
LFSNGASQPVIIIRYEEDMKNKTRISKLKESLHLAENIFSSHSELCIWASSVVPLLNFNQTHYKNFQESLHIIQTPTMSSVTINHQLTKMKSIINQTIIELENKIEPQNPFIIMKNVWHESFSGKILISVIAGIFVVIVGFYLTKFILEPKTEHMQQKHQQHTTTNNQLKTEKTEKRNP